MGIVKHALTTALSKNLDILHRAAPCPINKGAPGKESKRSLITSCLKYQKNKNGVFTGKSDLYRRCDDCKTGKIIKKYGMETDLDSIVLPRNLLILSDKESEDLKRIYNQDLKRFRHSRKYTRLDSMPAGRYLG